MTLGELQRIRLLTWRDTTLMMDGQAKWRNHVRTSCWWPVPRPTHPPPRGRRVESLGNPLRAGDAPAAPQPRARLLLPGPPRDIPRRVRRPAAVVRPVDARVPPAGRDARRG